MSDTDRRSILKLIGSGAFALSLPPSIRQALTVPAHNRSGSINDVEHVIMLMQENRSFDHYFGTLRGVRGFGDPRAVKLPSGKPVWNQPNGAGELLPFRPDVADVGMSFLPDPPHGWNDSHAAWNGGRHDQWVPNKGIDTMTYHNRRDVPFHYALADAFTICDAYHCSVLGPTDPNRYHMWTGCVGNDGAAGGPGGEVSGSEVIPVIGASLENINRRVSRTSSLRRPESRRRRWRVCRCAAHRPIDLHLRPSATGRTVTFVETVPGEFHGREAVALDVGGSRGVLPRR